ncbi:MAG: ABC transporter substrate-binding protein [Alphaproteobacteria bacterium]|nr:ABC transporter substrate-binding protein [Alphaproteobacteria bacterium]
MGARLSAIIAAMLIAGSAMAQGSGTPLRILVPYGPGAAADLSARILAEELRTTLGQPVVVENKPGAGGRVAAAQFKLTPVGQPTLMTANPALLVVAPLVYAKLDYDPDRDFVPVAHTNDYDFVIAVASKVPAKDMAGTIAWLRANPREANIGIPATGSLPHFFALMMTQSTGVKAEIIGYKGAASLNTDVMAGHMPVAFNALESAQVELHKAGKMRLIATSGAARSAFTPEIPTLREQGHDIVAKGWGVLVAPASMPAEAVARYGAAVAAAMAKQEVRQKFLNAGMEPASGDAAATRRMLAEFRARWEPAIKASNYKADD